MKQQTNGLFCRVKSSEKKTFPKLCRPLQIGRSIKLLTKLKATCRDVEIYKVFWSSHLLLCLTPLHFFCQIKTFSSVRINSGIEALMMSAFEAVAWTALLFSHHCRKHILTYLSETLLILIIKSFKTTWVCNYSIWRFDYENLCILSIRPRCNECKKDNKLTIEN